MAKEIDMSKPTSIRFIRSHIWVKRYRLTKHVTNEAYISADVSEQDDHFLEEHSQHWPEPYLAVPQYPAVQVRGG
ncbi:MAG: hypothetical protein AB1797_03125 [bacterium]